MVGRFAFDTETDGLLHELTKIHCLALYNIDTGQRLSFADQPGYAPVREGIEILANADLIVGHNAIGFDILAIEKVYPYILVKRPLVRDTMVLAKLLWPHIKDWDFAVATKGKHPKHLIGAHSLEAWGYRLGEFKDDYDGGWESWSPTMHSYMEQDTLVCFKLWEKAVAKAAEWGVPIDQPHPVAGKDCIDLEHRMAEVCARMQLHGFRFDLAKATALTATLSAHKARLENQLAEVFKPKEVKTLFVPKVNNKARGYVKGVPFTKSKTVPFSPSSRQQVAERMVELGWEPTEYGANGVPTCDDDTLEALPYKEAKLLAEYFMVLKRVGQVSNGKQGWLRHERAGRIHGRTDPGGTHTGRASHSSPNIGQVPGLINKKTGGPMAYGRECRECWIADDGWVLVGVDMDAVELCDLAGYMASWDDGDYIQTVLNGDKKLGTDIHSRNAKAIGCTRDQAKTFFYAMIYGAGDAKLGEALGFSGRKAVTAGKAGRANLMTGIPALAELVKIIGKRVDKKGFLVGLDGRHLEARAKNAALNTLLQSAGAVQSKRWIVGWLRAMANEGFEWGRDYALVAWVHDEIVVTCKEEIAERVKELARIAIKDAGEFYSFACPLSGSGHIGHSWADIH